MQWTKVSDLGVAGRLLVCVFIGFALTFVFVALALIGVALRNPMLSLICALPLAPAIGISFALHLQQSDIAVMAPALCFNAFVYGLIVFAVWRRVHTQKVQ